MHFTPSRGLSVHLRDQGLELAMAVDLVHADLTECDEPVQQRDGRGLLAERRLRVRSTTEFSIEVLEGIRRAQRAVVRQNSIRVSR